MISWWERLWLGLNAIALIVICTYMILFRALLDNAPAYDFFLSARGEMATFAVCGSLLLMNIGFVVYAMTTVDRKLVFHNEDGEITISLRAVETALSQAASALEDIHHVKVKFRVPPSGRGPIRIDVLGAIQNISDVRELTGKIQTLIKMKLSEMLQIEEDILFNVHFARTVSKPKSAAARSFRPALTPDEEYETIGDIGATFPFKYPVEKDKS